MVKAPSGYLRKPTAPTFVAPQVALEILAEAEARLGRQALAPLLSETGLSRPPGPTEPLPEAMAQALHAALRRQHPAEAPDILAAAGRATADDLIAKQLSARAQTMLSSGPWTIAAWLLGRWATQNSWTFAGSAVFVPIASLEFEMVGNPLIRGETSPTPICRFHEALFERLFQRLVDPRLICREIECQATGAPACRFAVALSG
jgi:divinyl protochlorophyllide a 8-vinyl-reductase